MTDYEAYLEDISNDEYDDAPHCEICGAKLIKITEKGEAWGSPWSQEFWECPHCDR